MGAKKGQNLSMSAMKSKKSNPGTSKAMRKKLTFAINARSWNKEDGGLLKEVTLGAGMGAAGGAIFGGAGALPGAIIGGGKVLLEELLSGLGNEEESIINTPNIIRNPNPYTNAPSIVPRKYGGKLLTQYAGPSHEEGGMQISDYDEVQGGENEFGGVVNSDDIMFTKNDIAQFGKDNGGDVPIYDQDVGKTPADIARRLDEKYSKFYDYDPFLVSEEENLVALGDMSEELAERNVPKDMFSFRDGGRIFTGKKVSPQQNDYFENVLQDGGNLLGNILSYAPAAINVIQGLSELNRPIEETTLPAISLDEYEPLSAEPAAQRVSAGFGTSKEALRRSGTLTQEGMIQLATEEEKALNKTYQSVYDTNIMGRNRQSYINTRARMFNAQQKTREAEIASADLGAGLTRTSAFFSSVGTNIGQIGRDIKLEEGQNRDIAARTELLEAMFPHLFGKKNKPLTEEETIESEFDIY